MSPAYKSAEQYERWHVRDCVRCGRRASKAANWGGAICRTCYAKALQTRGCCAGCGVDRLLPGRRDDTTPICRDCAGITRDFFCDRCGFEGHLHTGRLPAQATRVAALRQLVLQAPAPVVADALGYHNKHVTKVWAETGGNWKTYAPGDHSR
jgi:hypothetical protein